MNRNRKLYRSVLTVGITIAVACTYSGSHGSALAGVACEPIDGMPIAGLVPGALEKRRASAPLHVDPGMVAWVDGCKRPLAAR